MSEQLRRQSPSATDLLSAAAFRVLPFLAALEKRSSRPRLISSVDLLVLHMPLVTVQVSAYSKIQVVRLHRQVVRARVSTTINEQQAWEEAHEAWA